MNQNKTLLFISFFILVARVLPAQDTLIVRTDRSSEFMESEFRIGVTHTQSNWQYGNSVAVSRVKQNLKAAPVKLQNVHLMGWGPGNPSPSEGEYDWGSLDQRVALMRSMDAEMILTLCTAPGWMKISGEDWEMNDRVADEYFDDYAALCQMAALRYPDIQYFQVWNEFKGFWSKTLNDWDVAKYTEFYNIVYDSLRSVRPEAVIGGFYKGFSDVMTKGGVLGSDEHRLIDYWLANNVGADFIAFDGSIHGWPHVAVTEEELMEISSCFGNVAASIRAKTDLPIWVSEYYAANMVGSDQFQAANHASAYYHSLISGTAVALHWDPVGYAPLVTGTDNSAGGQSTSHYNVVSMFNRHYGPGRKLYETSCSDTSGLEVLASATRTLLINKSSAMVRVDLDGDFYDLEAYMVNVYERADTIVMVENESYSLIGHIRPFSTGDSSLSLNTDLAEVAEVDSTGMVTALSPGMAKITVRSEEFGFADQFSIVVRIQDDTLAYSLSLDMTVGETDTLSALIDQANLEGATWRSDNNSIVSVNEFGILTARCAGDAVITVTLRDGNVSQVYSIAVNVADKEVGIDGKERSGSEVRIYPNPLGRSYLNIDLGTLDMARISIVDITGCLVYDESVVQNVVIIPEGLLNSGIYIVSVKGEGVYWTGKLIVQ